MSHYIGDIGRLHYTVFALLLRDMHFNSTFIQSQETVERESFENLRELEKLLNTEKLKSQELKSHNTCLEDMIVEYKALVASQEEELQKHR